MVSFTDRMSAKKFVENKANPVGLINFVKCGKSEEVRSNTRSYAEVFLIFFLTFMSFLSLTVYLVRFNTSNKSHFSKRQNIY